MRTQARVLTLGRVKSHKAGELKLHLVPLFLSEKAACVADKGRNWDTGGTQTDARQTSVHIQMK